MLQVRDEALRIFKNICSSLLLLTDFLFFCCQKISACSTTVPWAWLNITFVSSFPTAGFSMKFSWRVFLSFAFFITFWSIVLLLYGCLCIALVKQTHKSTHFNGNMSHKLQYNILYTGHFSTREWESQRRKTIIGQTSILKLTGKQKFFEDKICGQHVQCSLWMVTPQGCYFNGHFCLILLWRLLTNPSLELQTRLPSIHLCWNLQFIRKTSCVLK